MDCVVLAITVTWWLWRSVVELNMIFELNLILSICGGTVALGLVTKMDLTVCLNLCRGCRKKEMS